MSSRTVEKTREIMEDLADYRRWVEDVEAGTVTPAQFRRRRLLAGMYGQIQPGVQMLRVKIPDGIVSASQFRALADAAQGFGHGILHITTRQAIQIHYIPRAQSPDLLEQLADHGLTGREGCGNTVRAVTVDPLAGLSADQVFDVRPVADALFRFFLLNPLSQNLPRKFKISVSGSKADRALSFMHDCGLVAVKQKGRFGFRLSAGGGLGAVPIGAEVVEEFLPVEKAVLAALALVRIHNDHGNRKVRAKARLKFIKERWGIEKFRTEFRKHLSELEGSTWGRQFLLDPATLALELPRSQALEAIPLPKGVPSAWVSGTVHPQIDGRFAVAVRVDLGDLPSATAKAVADLAERLGDGTLRTTIEQNLWIPGVDGKDLAKVWKGLRELGLSDHRFFEVSNPVACPGRTTCALSLTSSKGLASAITRALDRHPELDAPGRIRISGCTNSCGHHHIAEIGFHGMAKSVGGHAAPFFQVLIGGGAQDGVNRLARRTVRVAAKHAPDAVLEMLRLYHAKGGKKSLGEFLWKLPEATLTKALARFETIPSYEEDPSFYRDWDFEADYDPRPGLGAHAAVAVDLVDEWLYTAERHYLHARTQLSHRFWKDAVHAARLSLQQALRSGSLANGTEDTTLEADLEAYATRRREKAAFPAPDLDSIAPETDDEASARAFVADVGAFLDALLVLARRNPGAFASE
jgi:sulfite reductase beta subunit-like hemoprotein